MAVKLTSEKVMVKDNTDRVKNAEALLAVQATEIAAKVANTTFNALAQTVYENEAAIVIQAGNIASKVSQTNYNGETIASLINQAANEVKIQANKITLEGLITANGFFKVLEDGSIEAKNAVLSGSITATRMVATSSSNYYGEVGITDGVVGLGLFDSRYGTAAYCEMVELSSGAGFAIRDRNNTRRVEAGSMSTSIKDHNDNLIIIGSNNLRTIYSPNAHTYLQVSDSGVEIVKNNVTLAKWGF